MSSTNTREISIYIKRFLRVFVHEKRYFSIILSTIFMTVLIAWVTGENIFLQYSPTRNGAFALVCACIWIGIFNSIQSICKERATIKEEHRHHGLTFTSYTIAHMLFQALLCLTESLLVLGIIFLMKGSNLLQDGKLPFQTMFAFYITFFLIIYASDIFGLAASAISKNTDFAMTIMPFLLIVQLILSGFVFELEENARVLSNITISKWGLNAICIATDINSLDIEPDNYILLSIKDKNFSAYDPANSHLLKIWLILLFIVLICGSITRIALNFVNRDK